MDLNKQLRAMGRDSGIAPREEAISAAIAAARDILFQQEQDRLLTCREFLWTQLQYTRKRWWALQAALLVLACHIIPLLEDNPYRVRSTGVIGCLFVILMIPELWRNRESDSTQVEAACLYSLRQVYAARITLFGAADVAMLTLFCLNLGRMDFTLTQVLSQFLLPVTVTACICFSLLCGRAKVRQSASLAACLVWGGIWWLILMNEKIYILIAPSVWMALLALALLFLVLSICQAVRTTNQYWEVEFV